jgi:hypothetical protein
MASDELEVKDQSNKACIENKRGGRLGLLSTVIKQKVIF